MDLQEEIYLSELLAIYGEMLTERQREVMTLYYHRNESLQEIAERFGIGRQSVRDSLLAGKAQLLKWEAALRLFARFTAIRKEVGSLMSAADAQTAAALGRIIALTEE